MNFMNLHQWIVMAWCCQHGAVRLKNGDSVGEFASRDSSVHSWTFAVQVLIRPCLDFFSYPLDHRNRWLKIFDSLDWRLFQISTIIHLTHFKARHKLGSLRAAGVCLSLDLTVATSTKQGTDSFTVASTEDLAGRALEDHVCYSYSGP